MRRAAVALLALAAVGVVGPERAGAEIFGNTFRSGEWGVELTVPRGWELSEQRSYPGIIARAFEHKSGAHLLLAAERAAAGESARSYAERAQKDLVRVGYRVTGLATREGGAIVMDSTTPDKKRLLRQAYLVEGRVAYVLTVAVKAEAVRGSRPFEAFDEAMRTLTVSPPAEPDAGPAAPASQPAEPPRP